MSDIADYTHGEPEPIPNDGPSMHDLAMNDIRTAMLRSETIPESELKSVLGVIEELEARRAHGFKKYGVLLQANNGRNAVRDALDEALDMVVYIRQIVTERGFIQGINLDSMYRNAIEFAIGLKHILNQETQSDDSSGRISEAGSPDLAGGQHRAVQALPGEETS